MGSVYVFTQGPICVVIAILSTYVDVISKLLAFTLAIIDDSSIVLLHSVSIGIFTCHARNKTSAAINNLYVHEGYIVQVVL